MSGDLSAGCDRAVSRQLLTVTLMENLQRKEDTVQQISSSHFVSIYPGLLHTFYFYLTSFISSVKRKNPANDNTLHSSRYKAQTEEVSFK